jgi:hypothetical protein
LNPVAENALELLLSYNHDKNNLPS